MELRPLDLGEIFGRAATLYARYVPTFALVAFAVTLPLSVSQYLLDQIVQPQLQVLIQAFERAPVRAGALPPNVLLSPSLFGAEALSGLLAYAGGTIAFSAIAAGVLAAYRGERVTVAVCYGPVLRAWKRIAAIVGLGVLVLFAWDLLQTLLALVFIAATFGAVRAATTAVPLAGVLISITMMLTFALLVAILAFASFGVVFEGLPAVASLRTSFVRVFGRREVRRALLLSVGACVVMLAGSLCVNIVAVLGEHAAWGAVITLPEALLRAVVAPFPASLLAAYYLDVRIRHEGYDVELVLDRVAAGDPADDGGYAPTAYLLGWERELIKRFLERRDGLDATRRADLAARLAGPARERVGPDLRRLDDESLLERL